jgi:hypothetical protein
MAHLRLWCGFPYRTQVNGARGWDWEALPSALGAPLNHSFEVRLDGGLLLHSAEFNCPLMPRSLQTFEVSYVGGADEDGGCALEVWQGIFRIEVRVERKVNEGLRCRPVVQAQGQKLGFRR